MKNGNYELVKAPSDYPGKRYRGKYVYEHRLVWWQNTGDLAEDFDIHHKNENTRDNRFENLEKIDHAYHAGYHNRKRKVEDPILSCSFCRKNFVKNISQFRRGQKVGQINFFCSRSCQVKNRYRK